MARTPSALTSVKIALDDLAERLVDAGFAMKTVVEHAGEGVYVAVCLMSSRYSRSFPFIEFVAVNRQSAPFRHAPSHCSKAMLTSSTGAIRPL